VRLQHVTSADPRLADLTGLRDTQLRARREHDEGMFVAEGDTTITRAVAAGYRLRAVVSVARWLDRVEAAIAGVPDSAEVPVYVVDDDDLAAIAGFTVHRGPLASFERRPLPTLDDVVAGARRIVVLDDLVESTNLGLILRSVAALGWDGAVLTPRCADPLYRRAVKTSMGAVFSVPWTRIDHRLGPSLLREAGFRLLALTPDGTTDLGEVDGSGRVALVLGSEGPGVSRRWCDAADATVAISMRPGIDSLNVAAAAAIAL